ncbi:SRPBCC domain-containing protein [Nocardia aurantia]|uniref:Activator of Hsp90 ATPase homologue 1/2-like C-terminal domain-containing protein n=1 Tax=Nocardia aurantia TaxID=2585199 RepID=A0A7K0DP34_9NOCA|nr:SRPBCC domain-containing protein [Nocardia aurantia]MQY27142.1 hypothetical protein [Nocardia aurantia]
MTTTVEADPVLPIIRISRAFTASAAQLFRAHTDPALYARWVGPAGTRTRIEHWDARTGGSWRYVSLVGGVEYGFHGCFHEVRPDRIVQTFTYEGEPDNVALQTLRFEDCGAGRSRLRVQSLVDSIESRNAQLSGDMETGITQGYAELEGMIIDGDI